MSPDRPQQSSFFQTAPAVRADGADVLRLHLNESAFGPPPGAVEAVQREAADSLPHYPDPAYARFRAALARHFRVPEEMLALGNGVDELVLLTSLAFLTAAPEAATVTTDHTFPGYLAAATAVGAQVRSLPLRGYRIPADQLADAVRDGAHLAFACNPLNPTGALLTRDETGLLLSAARHAPGVLVFDEAYLDFTDPAEHYALAAVRDGARALVLRTFSKAWGLASLRIGCAIGPPDLVTQVNRAARALPFRVSRPAERAVLQALAQPGYLERVRAETADARDLLVKGVRTAGAEPLPSAANFVMARVPTDSAWVAARLAERHRVLVRDLGLLNLPGHLRITVGTREQTERCATALQAVLAEAPTPVGTASEQGRRSAAGTPS
ncbi:histidinol-phosphate aminotransferase family protein [Streptomyces sp. JJ66]|uniref:pyridoxal phosphate-dependent aminotransferase n=1 Tax=Streptomyces sp. JJ66 TaxID=2803843 RepID=UPI001C55BD70|nr:histidinol-phosphate transaminase [Streptomyces sp. JJ66]MBW1602233.1 histidinol-phosphate aminotransferase family protein [Streptomyces sp. JJ66]